MDKPRTRSGCYRNQHTLGTNSSNFPSMARGWSCTYGTRRSNADAHHLGYPDLGASQLAVLRGLQIETAQITTLRHPLVNHILDLFRQLSHVKGGFVIIGITINRYAVKNMQDPQIKIIGSHNELYRVTRNKWPICLQKSWQQRAIRASKRRPFRWNKDHQGVWVLNKRMPPGIEWLEAARAAWP